MYSTPRAHGNLGLFRPLDLTRCASPGFPGIFSHVERRDATSTVLTDLMTCSRNTISLVLPCSTPISRQFGHADWRGSGRPVSQPPDSFNPLQISRLDCTTQH